jgi:hypothetical protein
MTVTCHYLVTCMYYFGRAHILDAVRLTSDKANTLQQTQQPVLMPVLNLDRVLLADSDTCFTFNTKFAISLHMITRVGY